MLLLKLFIAWPTTNWNGQALKWTSVQDI